MSMTRWATYMSFQLFSPSQCGAQLSSFLTLDFDLSRLTYCPTVGDKREFNAILIL